MNILGLQQLQQPDDRALVFTPWGLSLSGPVDAEQIARYQQEAVASAELASAVPNSTRQSFDRLRGLHTYGVMFYDAYTIVSQQAPIVLDLALRERFLAFYAAGVPFVQGGRKGVITDVSSFEAFRDSLMDETRRLRKEGAKGRWMLACGPQGEMSFSAGFNDLLRWARHVGLLHGQRNRAVERALGKLRNLAAHPSGYQIDSPVQSARILWDVAEIINRLWGATTSGGRLYPHPIRREVIAIGWGGHDGSLVQFLADPDRDDVDGSKTYILVLGVWQDPTLTSFDAAFERTTYPVRLLFGPARWRAVATWLHANTPGTDEVPYLDRLFLVRRHDHGVDLPRSAEVAAGISGRERAGEWHLIQADHAGDAYLHVRGPGGTPNSTCEGTGPCNSCHVNVIAQGPWESVAKAFDAEPASPPPVRVPSLYELG